MPHWKANDPITYTTSGSLERPQIDGLVLERRNSSALGMELRLSCINPPNGQGWIEPCSTVQRNHKHYVGESLICTEQPMLSWLMHNSRCQNRHQAIRKHHANSLAKQHLTVPLGVSIRLQLVNSWSRETSPWEPKCFYVSGGFP